MSPTQTKKISPSVLIACFITILTSTLIGQNILYGRSSMERSGNAARSISTPHNRSASAIQFLAHPPMLIGADMTDEVAGQAKFDLRAQYLAGGLADGAEPCGRCDVSCSAGGQTCDNKHGCRWWGCWQWDQQRPGQFVRDFVKKTTESGQTPVFTYYQLLQTSGVSEGAAEVAAVSDPALMARYFNDWLFVLTTIEKARAIVHIEPDFWGFAQQVHDNAHAIPAAVAAANPTDCGAYENSVAGLGQCMIHMARKYAPNVKVGLHASAWATRVDILQNVNPKLDIEAHAAKVGAFLRACGGATADLVIVDASDRDAGYYDSIGQDRWWDDSNQTLPNFHQAFRWASQVSRSLELPNLWWQLPVGNMDLPNRVERWRDNRVDYFFDHVEELIAARSTGMIFGAGMPGQTSPATDHGHLIARVRSYSDRGETMAASDPVPLAIE